MTLISDAAAPHFERPGLAVTGLASPARGAKENAAWIITVDPGSPGLAHRVTREELFVALEGAARPTIDGTPHDLVAGGALIVPANAELVLANPHHVPFRAVCVQPVGAKTVVEGAAPFVPPWAQ